MVKAWPPLLGVTYSEMRNLCLSYWMQSKCGGEWHSTGPERWVQENTVTFAGPSGQMWLFFSACHFRHWFSSCYQPRQHWRLHRPDLYFSWILPLLLPVTVLHHLSKDKNQTFVVCGEKEPRLHGKNWLEERMKLKKLNIPTPADTFVHHPQTRFAFRSLQHVFGLFCLPSLFIAICPNTSPKTSSVWWSEL